MRARIALPFTSRLGRKPLLSGFREQTSGPQPNPPLSGRFAFGQVLPFALLDLAISERRVG